MTVFAWMAYINPKNDYQALAGDEGFDLALPTQTKGYRAGVTSIYIALICLYTWVMFKEKVRANGDVLISEMNAVGWDIMNERIIVYGSISQYNFIH